MKCTICPRKCGADRENGEKGRCGCGADIIVSRAALHLWEEPCIGGKNGAGAIFFGGCPLGCVFCQNHGINRGTVGKAVSESELTDIMKRLEDEGAECIDLVSPTQYSAEIRRALTKYKPSVPVVWNSGGYDRTETLKSLEGLIDVYLPDVKYFDAEVSQRYADCPDYFEVTARAVKECVRQVGTGEFDENGKMLRGVLIRHLVLPTHIRQSLKILEWIARELPDDVYVSIMGQYFPTGAVSDTEYAELNRPLYEKEYNAVINKFRSLGLKNGFCQELSSADGKYVPDWDM